jgi:hypothetical protein
MSEQCEIERQTCHAVRSDRTGPTPAYLGKDDGWWSRVQDAALYSSQAAAQRALKDAADGLGRVVEVELIVREVHPAPT